MPGSAEKASQAQATRRLKSSVISLISPSQLRRAYSEARWTMVLGQTVCTTPMTCIVLSSS